jgi:hypothetical protein
MTFRAPPYINSAFFRLLLFYLFSVVIQRIISITSRLLRLFTNSAQSMKLLFCSNVSCYLPMHYFIHLSVYLPSHPFLLMIPQFSFSPFTSFLTVYVSLLMYSSYFCMFFTRPFLFVSFAINFFYFLSFPIFSPCSSYCYVYYFISPFSTYIIFHLFLPFTSFIIFCIFCSFNFLFNLPACCLIYISSVLRT